MGKGDEAMEDTEDLEEWPRDQTDMGEVTDAIED